MENTVIFADNISYSYPVEEGKSPVLALDGVTIKINRGEFVAVLGHNGSGKSTFAKHLNAILLPSGGTVYIDNMDTRDESLLLAIRSRCGMVFQNPDNQIVATVVEEDVAFAPENMGVPPEEIRRRVDRCLDIVGMSQYKKHAPHLLSGGQKQRVAIAGVLAMEPSILVMDEPTAMLDPSGRREVMSTILELNKQRDMTVVLITHHMDEAAMAQRVIVMHEGEVALEGTPREVFSQVERIRGLSLLPPQTVDILFRLNKRGYSLPLDGMTVEECADTLEDFLKGRGSEASFGQSPSAQERPQKNQRFCGENILKVDNISHIYSAGTPFEKRAIDGVGLTVGKGEFVGLIGHTGSGKSTLVQHFNGLLAPTSGHVYVDGVDINSSPQEARKARFKVGLVFQYPEYQLFEETIYRDIAFGPKNMGLDEDEIDRRVKRAASQVGLEESLLEASPFDLSGGQKRRAALAGVFAMEPELLVLDEPMAGLDPVGREEIISCIESYRRETGSSVLFVTHSMEDAARISDRLIVLSGGKVLTEGAPEEVFSRSGELLENGLDIPMVTRLFIELNRRGIALPPSVYTTEQAVEEIIKLREGGHA